MKSNRLGQSSQEETRPPANAVEIASSLIQFAENFGIARELSLRTLLKVISMRAAGGDWQNLAECMILN